MEDKIIFVESNRLIAERVPPGDQWELVDDRGTLIEGLVLTLTTFMRQSNFKGHYRLEPLNGKLYAIETEEITIPEPVQEKFDLYGEF